MIRRTDCRVTAQMAFALGRFLGQDVPQVCLRAFKAAASERLEALRGAALGLEFWHLLLLTYFSLTPGVPCRALCCLGITCFDDLIARILAVLFRNPPFVRIHLPANLATSLLLLRTHHHDHLAAFHFWKLLDHPVRFKVRLYPFEKLETKFLVCHFPAAEAQGNFGLVAFVQKTGQIA